MIITGLFETHVLPLWIFHHFYLAVPHSFIRSELKNLKNQVKHIKIKLKLKKSRFLQILMKFKILRALDVSPENLTSYFFNSSYSSSCNFALETNPR